MALRAAEILDLIEVTLADKGELKFDEAAAEFQRHEVFGRIMKDRSQSELFEGGTSIERHVMVTTTGHARQVGMHAQDVVNIGDIWQKTSTPWRHTNTYYAWERREFLMNRGKKKIQDLILGRRSDSTISFADHVEKQFWAKPADSSDELEIFGAPYWVVSNNTEGHNGSLADGFSSGPGGLNSDTYTGTKNYSGQYTNVTKTDLIKMMRAAQMLTNFKSPIDFASFRTGVGQRFRIYVNKSVVADMEDVGEAQNENLGRDLGSTHIQPAGTPGTRDFFEFDGALVFRRAPVVWVPALDGDSTNPVYMLDLAFFHPVFLTGDFMHEDAPAKFGTQHNTIVVQQDTTWNVICTRRRAQTVFTL